MKWTNFNLYSGFVETSNELIHASTDLRRRHLFEVRGKPSRGPRIVGIRYNFEGNHRSTLHFSKSFNWNEYSFSHSTRAISTRESTNPLEKGMPVSREEYTSVGLRVIGGSATGFLWSLVDGRNVYRFTDDPCIDLRNTRLSAQRLKSIIAVAQLTCKLSNRWERRWKWSDMDRKIDRIKIVEIHFVRSFYSTRCLSLCRFLSLVRFCKMA